MNSFKKFLSLALVVSVILLCFTGCESAYATSFSNYTDYEGVYIMVEEIRADGLNEILSVVWHNDTDYTVTFGLNYTVEVYSHGEWKSVQVTDFAIPEIACVLEPHSTEAIEYSTEYFNTLVSGDYRIKVWFYVDNGEESISGSSYAPFAKGYK